MYRNLIPTLSLIVLLGCATGHFVPDVPMRKVGPHTRVGVQHTDSGFRMRVDYTEKNTSIYRVIENCQVELISLAEQYAETYPRPIQPIDKDGIKIVIARLPAGVRGGSCEATARIQWVEATEPG